MKLHIEVENSILKFKDISLSICISNKIPTTTTIHIDKNGFEKVVDNLLSNALKYNQPNGYINICFEKNLLSFENSGKSINVDNIFSVFDIYFQEDSSKDGFGLGLHVVKEFCDKNRIAIYIKPLQNGTKIELDLKNVVEKDNLTDN